MSKCAGFGVCRKGDRVPAFRLAGDDWLVRDGLIGITRQGSRDRGFADFDIQPSPAVVGFAFDLEFKSKKAVFDIKPRAIGNRFIARIDVTSRNNQCRSSFLKRTVAPDADARLQS